MLHAASNPGPLPPPDFDEVAVREGLLKLSAEDLAVLKFKLEWRKIARSKQLPPDDPVHGDAATNDWVSWGLRSGRGFGKTLTAAHWMGEMACDMPGSFNHVIAPTRDDVRYTCFEGQTGLLTILPEILIADYNKSDLIIYLWNGALIRGFGSERPDKLRGPQCHNVWCEEVSSWQNAKHTWSNMKFGHRLGKKPRLTWTTTPKPLPIIKQLSKAADGKKHFMVLGSTYENKANLSDSFYEEVAQYEGTKLGRQELYGELIDPEEDGIVQRSQWRLWPASEPLPRFLFVLMSLDTAYTEKTFDKKEQTSDPSACTVWGLFEQRNTLHVMLLDAWDDRLGLPELIKRVRTDGRKTYGRIDKPLVGGSLIPSPWIDDKSVLTGTPIGQILVEDKGSGISLRQMLAMENLLLEPYNPGRADKLSRLHSVTPMFAHGRVWTVESNKRPGEVRAWADKAISEICSYHGPGTTEHDDYVDTCSQALSFFMRRFIFSFVEKSPEQLAEERERLEQEEVNSLHTLHPYG